MSAKGRGRLRAAAAFVALSAASAAIADASPPPAPPAGVPGSDTAAGHAPSPWTVELTQADEPDSKAWEEPARIAFTIDPHGPDQFSAQVNLGFKRDLAPERPGPRNTIGTYLRWNRETGTDEPQNNFEAGFSFGHHFDVERLLSIPDELFDTLTPAQLSDLADARGNRSRFNYRGSTGYARTAHYPDLGSAVCVATPALPQCQTQFKESIRTSVAVTMFSPRLAGNLSGRGAYSIAPKLQFDHDLLLNSPINVATGVVARGSYFSVLAGVAITLSPTFLNPSWELHGEASLRQRLYASDSRRPSIEASAEQFEVSATYYFLRPPPTARTGWRVGLGLTYTHGGDPLTGTPDGDRIVLALRVGQF